MVYVAYYYDTQCQDENDDYDDKYDNKKVQLE